MSDPTEVSGGRYVTADEWTAQFERLGCRAAVRPGDPGPVYGGEFPLRFACPQLAGGRDVLVQVSMEYFHPPADVPAAVVRRHQSRLRLRQLGAPSTVIAHETINAAWVAGGRAAVVIALEALLAEQRANGWSEEDLAELRQWITSWRQPDCALTSSVLFESQTFTEAGLLVDWLLPIAYAAASGGRVFSVGAPASPERTALHLGQVDRTLASLRQWDLFDGAPPAEELFTGWRPAKTRAKPKPRAKPKAKAKTKPKAKTAPTPQRR